MNESLSYKRTFVSASGSLEVYQSADSRAAIMLNFVEPEAALTHIVGRKVKCIELLIAPDLLSELVKYWISECLEASSESPLPGQAQDGRRNGND